MREEKRNRIIAAIVVNAILLIFIMVGVLVAQIVEISVLTRRKNYLVKEANRLYYVLNDEALPELERLQTDEEYRLILQQLVQMGVEFVPYG